MRTFPLRPVRPSGDVIRREIAELSEDDGDPDGADEGSCAKATIANAMIRQERTGRTANARKRIA
jgi:hypothetical protein